MLVRSYKIAAPKRFENYIDDVVSNAGDAIVKIDKVAICKADLRYYIGNRPPRLLGLKYPLNLIHEAIGTVYKDLSGEFKPSDKVVFVPNLIPNNVDKKSLKRYATPELGENYCPEALFASSNYDGFSKEYISFPKRNLLKLPKDVDDNILVFIELISVAHAAYRRTNINKKDVVAIWGDGILGFIVCSLLKSIGISHVVVVGRHEEKLRKFPADEIYLTDDIKLKKVDIDVAFECVGGLGASDAINDIIDGLNVGGKLLLTGVSEEKSPINTRKILEKGISIYGVTRSSINDFAFALSLMENNQFRKNIDSIILGEKVIKSVQDFSQAFEDEISNKKLGKWILNYEF